MLGLLPIQALHLRQIPRDAALHLRLREIPVPVVQRLELAPVDRDERILEQIELAAQHHELPAHLPDRSPVVSPEVRDRLEVRRQSARQPHQLHVPLCFSLQPMARLHAVHVPVDKELQHHRRLIPRSPRLGRLRLETEQAKIQLVHEHIDHPHRALFGNVVIESLGEQRGLVTIRALDETAHG